MVIPAGAAVQVLPFTANAAALAREALRIYAARLPPELMQDATLLTSELVSNAIRYGRPPVTLAIERAPDQLTVSVRDTAPALPVLTSVGPEVERGRGLQIVASVADHWGVEPEPTGKRVWFQLQVHPRPFRPATG